MVVGGWVGGALVAPAARSGDAQKPVPTLLPPLTPVCSPSTRCVCLPMCVWVLAGGRGFRIFNVLLGVPLQYIDALHSYT